MSKFEVQSLDEHGYIDDTSLEYSLEDAVSTLAAWSSSGNFGSAFKIVEQIEVPFVIERADQKPSGREPVSRTVNGVTVRTL